MHQIKQQCSHWIKASQDFNDGMKMKGKIKSESSRHCYGIHTQCHYKFWAFMKNSRKEENDPVP